MDGFGITECGSLACLSNPCRNGAICVEMNDDNDDRTNAANHNYKPQHPYEDNNNEDDGYAFHMMETRQRQPPKTHDKWKCKCPTGYMGAICEISVCDDNPCQYGATCVTFPGSGYLCLCPLGKHGHYCEHSKSITLHYVYIWIGATELMCMHVKRTTQQRTETTPKQFHAFRVHIFCSIF